MASSPHHPLRPPPYHHHAENKLTLKCNSDDSQSNVAHQKPRARPTSLVRLEVAVAPPQADRRGSPQASKNSSLGQDVINSTIIWDELLEVRIFFPSPQQHTDTMFGKTLLLAALALSPAAALWPVPIHADIGNKTLFIDKSIEVTYNGKQVNNFRGPLLLPFDNSLIC